MIYNFLKECSPILENEKCDFESVLKKFEKVEKSYTGFMPAIVGDIYPVFALECTSANKIVNDYVPQVYIIPIEGHGDWALLGFNNLINNFYDNDELGDESIYYSASLEEVLLLEKQGIENHLAMSDGTGYGVVYCLITMPNGVQVDLIVMCMKPEDCWMNVMEKYDISCDILVDSNKGMGDWFFLTPLYSVMKNTSKSNLLPKFYFCGKYASGGAPPEFEPYYTIPENIKRVTEYDKTIYLTNW